MVPKKVGGWTIIPNLGSSGGGAGPGAVGVGLDSHGRAMYVRSGGDKLITDATTQQATTTSVEGENAASQSASHREDGFVGMGPIEQWHRAWRPACLGGGAHHGPRSVIGCAVLNIPGSGARATCNASNIMLRFDLTQGDLGGEDTRSVIGRNKALERYSYLEGFMSGTCTMDMDALYGLAEGGGLQPAASNW